MGHRRSQSRALLDIGRTHRRADKSDVADLYFKKALRGRVGDRRRAEIYLWQGWNYQDEGRNLKEANRCLQETLRLAAQIESKWLIVEAKIALGHLGILNDEFDEAERLLLEATALADQLNVTKLVINAHLSLSELYARETICDTHAALNRPGFSGDCFS